MPKPNYNNLVKRVNANVKQKPASVDEKVTRERVVSIWSDLDRTAQDKLTDRNTGVISKATMYTIQNTGRISSTNALILGESLNFDPSYLAGLTSENCGYNEAAAQQFIEVGGFAREPEKAAKKLQLMKKEADQRKKEAAERSVEKPVYTQYQAPQQPEAAPINTPITPEISRDYLHSLADALYVRAQYLPHAMEDLRQLFAFLLYTRWDLAEAIK